MGFAGRRNFLFANPRLEPWRGWHLFAASTETSINDNCFLVPIPTKKLTKCYLIVKGHPLQKYIGTHSDRPKVFLPSEEQYDPTATITERIAQPAR